MDRSALQSPLVEKSVCADFVLQREISAHRVPGPAQQLLRQPDSGASGAGVFRQGAEHIQGDAGNQKQGFSVRALICCYDLFGEFAEVRLLRRVSRTGLAAKPFLHTP